MFEQIRFAWRRRRFETELREELETHRALRQDQFERAGMAAAEAAYASGRALGNVTLAIEDARAVWISERLDGLRQDATYALRIVGRSPAFACAMVLVLTLGIAAASAVFGLVDGLILRSLPVRAPDQLVWFRSPAFSYPIFTEVRRRASHIFSGFFAWNVERMNVQWTGEPESGYVMTATGDFYSTLGVGAAAGRTFDAADDRIGGGPSDMVAVLSYACWQRRFAGDLSVIGKVLYIDRHAFTIIGVTQAGFSGVAPGLAPEVTIPLLTLQTSETLRMPSTAWLHLMGRLRDGVSIDEGNRALQAFWPAVLNATTNPGMPADRRAMYLGRQTALEPGRTGFSRVRNQFEAALWMLMGLVALLLAVAAASAANLLLARGVSRGREIAVRLAIGADRARLIRQLLTESLIWTTIGAALAVPLASIGAGALVTLMSTWRAPIALDVRPHWRSLLFTLATTLVATAACAIVPALRATRVDPVVTLTDRRPMLGGGFRRWSLGQSIVVLQVALTVVLLGGSALFLRSLARVLYQDAGVDRDAVVAISASPTSAGYRDERLTAYYDTLLQQLRSVAVVRSASLSWYPPISNDMGSWTQSVAIDGTEPRLNPSSTVFFNAISPGYFETVGMRLVAGRDFAAIDTAAATRVVIVNESLARRFFAGQDPLGRRITIGRDQSRRDLLIVGVVQDAKYQRLQEATRSIAYLPCAQLGQQIAGVNLVAETRVSGSASAATSAIRLAAREIDPQVPIRVETIADRIRESLVRERAIAILATIIGAAGLLLACVALSGLLAYAVSRERTEIGIRLALGATYGTVLTGVVRRCLTLTFIGVALGVSASLALGRYVATLLYQISPADPVALAGASAIMLVVATCAGLVPARRAARVNPVDVLKGC